MARDTEQAGTPDALEFVVAATQVLEDLHNDDAIRFAAEQIRMIGLLDETATAFRTLAENVAPNVQWSAEYQPHYSAILMKPLLKGKGESLKSEARVLREQIADRMRSWKKPHEDIKVFTEYPGLPTGY